jgi:hypothetical protein
MTVEDEIQQRANQLVLRIGRMGDDELMSPIFKEALMNERRIALEDCLKAADDQLKELWREGCSPHGSFSAVLLAIRSLFGANKRKNVPDMPNIPPPPLPKTPDPSTKLGDL